MAKREGVPFKCEECGGEFAATDGGLCRSCRLATNLLEGERCPVPFRLESQSDRDQGRDRSMGGSWTIRNS
jgi:hypothetical protein